MSEDMYAHMRRFRGATVLVTGGTGSIGSIVSRKLIEAGASVTILSRDESKQSDFQRTLARGAPVHFTIGDVRDASTLLRAMRGQEVVIHAAAMKHVDKCQSFPDEAIRSNIIGALNVFEAAALTRPDSVVMVSTDKAAYAGGYMGRTKRIAEDLFLLGDLGIVSAKVTRFGNVLGSRGSVVPKFRELIREGKKLPVTDLDMLRFYMTPNEAADVVLWACACAPNKSITSRVMHSISLRDLLEALDTKPDQWEVTGNRGGEKFEETLLEEDELRRAVIYDEGRLGRLVVVHQHSRPKLTQELSVEGLKDALSVRYNRINALGMRSMLKEAGA